jgi:hypothetical protein
MGTRREQLDLIVSAKDRSKSALSSVTRNIVGVVAAYKLLKFGVDILKDSISEAANYGATLLQIKRIAEVTGRSYNKVLEAMKSQTGGLATQLTIATGFLKGLTTTLSVKQINQMTTAISDASTAMGENFNVQLPLIIKAIKQLNPAILDNIGVTVRLDRLNKRIREGYFGLSKEINETTQQHAIFTEIMRQTAKFRGADNVLLNTNIGLWQLLQTELVNAKKRFGDFLSAGEAGHKVEQFLRRALSLIAGMEPTLKFAAEALLNWVKFLGSVFVDGGKIVITFSKLLRIALVDPFRNTLSPVREFFTILRLQFQSALIMATGLGDVLGSLFVLDFAGADAAFDRLVKRIADVQLKTMQSMFLMNLGLQSVAIPAWDEFTEAVETNGARLALTFGDAFNSTSEFVDALLGVIEDAFKSFPKDAKRAVDATTIASKDGVKEVSAFAKFAVRATQATMEFAFDSFRGNLAANLFETREVLKEIFKGMARDFIQFFIDEAIKALAGLFIPKVVSLVASIFGLPVNSGAIAEEGERASRAFVSGATGAFGGANLGAQTVRNAVGGVEPDRQAERGTTIVFQNPVTYTGFFRDARRALEDVSRRRPLQLNTRSISSLQTQAVRFS